MAEKGYCEKHGEVTLWMICEHIASNEVEKIILSWPATGLCHKCSERKSKIDTNKLTSICGRCLKEFIKEHLIQAIINGRERNTVIGTEYFGTKEERN